MGTRNKVDVYGILKDKIIFLEMKPGSKIIEPEIAEELCVSRTPVREALKRLEEERFVDIYPQRGTYVSLIDYKYVKEVTLMRHILECDILEKLCIDRAKVMPSVEDKLAMMKLALKNHDYKSYITYDSKFHEELFRIAGHETIWLYIYSVIGHYTRMLVLDMMTENSIEKSYDSHIKIVEKIENGDVKALQELLEEHHDHKVTEEDKKIIEANSDFFLI